MNPKLTLATAKRVLQQIRRACAPAGQGQGGGARRCRQERPPAQAELGVMHHDLL